MEATTYRAGRDTRVLSALTAARLRTPAAGTTVRITTGRLTTGRITLGPVITPRSWVKCALTQVTGMPRPVSPTMSTTTDHGSFQDRGLAINPFPSRSGPPCSQ